MDKGHANKAMKEIEAKAKTMMQFFYPQFGKTMSREEADATIEDYRTQKK